MLRASTAHLSVAIVRSGSRGAFELVVMVEDSSLRSERHRRDMDNSTFVYVIYLNATADSTWRALTDGEITRLYWSNHRNDSDWREGSEWRHEDYDDSTIIDIAGTVVESDAPNRLVVTWAPPTAPRAKPPSRVAFDIAEDDNMVRLTLTHDNLEPGSDMARGIREGWPMVLSSLKTLLETREAMPAIWTRDSGSWKRQRFNDDVHHSS